MPKDRDRNKRTSFNGKYNSLTDYLFFTPKGQEHLNCYDDLFANITKMMPREEIGQTTTLSRRTEN